MTSATNALPDAVLGFGAMHLGLRAEAASIQSLVDGGRLADAVRRADVLAHVLGEHHRNEDDLLWPALVARQPGFLPTSATLEGQHAQLDDELHELRADPQRIGTVRSLIEDHLRLEEETVLPVWLASFTAAEHERFGRLLRRSTSLDSVGVVVSWLLDVTPDALRGIAIGKLPGPFRLAHRAWWGPSYRRRFGTHLGTHTSADHAPAVLAMGMQAVLAA